MIKTNDVGKRASMIHRTIWTLALAMSLMLASAAGAAPTAMEECQAAKLQALRRRAFCIEGERRLEILGKTPDAAKCEAKFDKAIAKANEAAAKRGTSCRWLENGDGTATDLATGLQWELKTDDGIHDKDLTFTWSEATGLTRPTGSAFRDFLGGLDADFSSDGSSTTDCFANHCDWRMPTVEELRSILDAEPGNCTIDPCTTIPGETLSGPHWSRSTLTDVPTTAWFVSFEDGSVDTVVKTTSLHVRAVRTGP